IDVIGGSARRANRTRDPLIPNARPFADDLARIVDGVRPPWSQVGDRVLNVADRRGRRCAEEPRNEPENEIRITAVHCSLSFDMSGGVFVEQRRSEAAPPPTSAHPRQ